MKKINGECIIAGNKTIGELQETLDAAIIKSRKKEIEKYKSFIKKTELPDRAIDIFGTKYPVEDLGEITDEKSMHDCCVHNTIVLETETYHLFKITYVDIDVIGFNSYFLKDIKLQNIGSTKFIGENRYSVLNTGESLFDIGNTNKEMIEKIKMAYETDGPQTTFICIDDGEGNCKYGWKEGPYTDETGRTIYALYIGESPQNDRSSLRFFIKFYPMYPSSLLNLNQNARISGNFNSSLSVAEDKYNGYRAAQAETIYKFYGWAPTASEESFKTWSFNWKYLKVSSGSGSTGYGGYSVDSTETETYIDENGEEQTNQKITLCENNITFNVPELQKYVNQYFEEVNNWYKANKSNLNYSFNKKIFDLDKYEIRENVKKKLELLNNYGDLCKTIDEKIAEIKKQNPDYEIDDFSDVNKIKNLYNPKDLGSIDARKIFLDYADAIMIYWVIDNGYFSNQSEILKELESDNSYSSLYQNYHEELLTGGECKQDGEQIVSNSREDRFDTTSYISNDYVQIDNLQDSTINEIFHYSNSDQINIMNPAALSSIYVDTTKELVTHTLGKTTAFELQVGAKTTLVPRIDITDSYELTLDQRKEYIGYYIYVFDFPVQVDDGNTKDNKRTYNAGEPVILEVDLEKRNSKSTIVEIKDDNSYDLGGQITIIPTGHASATTDYAGYLTSKVKLDKDTISCMAVTNNVPSITAIEQYYNKYKEFNDDGTIKQNTEYFTIQKLCTTEQCVDGKTTNNTPMTELVDAGEKIRLDSHYFSNIVTLSTFNLSRIYDFRITDCTDVNFKNVFRESEGNNVNKHTGKVYFSGIKSIDIYRDKGIYITNNNSTQVNTVTLPLGPYKNTNGTYVEAPKLGYRISFDLKTSGYYRPNSGENRTIVILPKLYYIKKDAKNADDVIFDVNAYYKDSTGKYVKIDQATNFEDPTTYTKIANGSVKYNGYQITYVPNDGYRNVVSQGITPINNWFSKEQKTLNMSALILTNEMMCTNDDGFIQTWYGEYKLPNSTILVKEGETNLNNYLTDGYCGVIFYIGVVEKRSDGTVVMSYNTSDKNSSNQMNTTQWDYEGHLGLKSTGTSNVNLSIRLARSTISVDNNLYQKIKGTVLLYDLDNRAASDFD